MKTITQHFESWQTELDNFQDCAKKELEDIRQCKQDIQSMKNELMEELGEISQLSRGRYIRDNQRIILSAPEIVIGNVDKNGVMFNIPSKIIIRGNEVGLEGVGLDTGAGGRVTTRAAQIRQIAEDPGKDGLEHAVLPTSEIVSQAKSIALKTEEAEGLFSSSASATMQGIELNSETAIALHATRSVNHKKTKLEATAKSLKERSKELESKAKEQKKRVDALIKDMQELSDSEDLTADIITTRTSYLDIDELFEQFNNLSGLLYGAMTDYYQTLALLAETNRQVSCLETMEKKVDSQKAKFKEESTGTFISMRSENIHALSIDGDGNYRENPGAGFSVTAKSVGIRSVKVDSSLHENGSISLQAETVSLDTSNPKLERDKDGSIKKGEYPVEGNVSITSRNISLQAVDYELTNDKLEEKALTKGSSVYIRTENVNVSATDTEGKATGQVTVNSKDISLKSMDVDKEKRTDKGLATGSQMLLVSEKMYAGSFDKKLRSKQVQVASEQVGIFADNTLELQQDKAVVQLASGNTAVGGGNLDLYGKTTLQGEVTAKGAIKGGDLEVKNMDVKSSFKSPCTSEGMAVPGAPATGKLSAKLKEEELKTE